MVMGGGFVIGLVLIFLLLLFLVAAIIAGVWVYRQNSGVPGSSADRRDMKSMEDPLEILKRRYASGEINREEFERMREDIRNWAVGEETR